MNFSWFGSAAASGPRPKSLMVLGLVLALWAAVRRRWFAFGFFAAAAALTWQPSGLLLLVAAWLAWSRSAPGERRAAPLRLGAGVAVPTAAVVAWFASRGAALELWDAAVAFNLTHIERLGSGRSAIVHMAKVLVGGYPESAVVILVGGAALLGLAGARLARVGGSLRRWLSNDRWAAVVSSYPLVLLWTLFDLQGPADYFFVLPYVALGITVWVAFVLSRLERRGDLTAQRRRAVSVVLCGLLAVLAASGYALKSSSGLRLQRHGLEQALALAGGDAKVVSIGMPEALVLLRRENPNPYLFVINGIDNRIEATFPGGIDGWLEGIDADLIAYGETTGRHAGRIRRWLDTNFERLEIGEQVFYLKRSAVLG